MSEYSDYPKWVEVDGPGNPLSPGKVLVGSEEEELAALESGKGPDHLNPVSEIDMTKPLVDMDRRELISTLVGESITEEVTDDQIRSAIEAFRTAGAKPVLFTPSPPANPLVSGDDARPDASAAPAPFSDNPAKNDKDMKDQATPDPAAKK